MDPTTAPTTDAPRAPPAIALAPAATVPAKPVDRAVERPTVATPAVHTVTTIATMITRIIPSPPHPPLELGTGRFGVRSPTTFVGSYGLNVWSLLWIVPTRLGIVSV